MTTKNEMIKKNNKPHLIIASFAVAVFAVLLVGGVAIAVSGIGINNTFSGDVTINQNASVGTDSFGSTGLTATSTPTGAYTNFDNVSTKECYRIGEQAEVDSESWTRCLIVQDFADATVTPVVLENPYDVSDRVYIRDLWVQLLGKATTTVRLAVTTSTATSIAADNATILTEDAGAAALMRTFGNAWGADGGTIATGTNFFLTYKPGTYDSRQVMPVVWPNDVNVIVYATSSQGGLSDNNCGITCATNTFSGELYMIVDIVK